MMLHTDAQCCDKKCASKLRRGLTTHIGSHHQASSAGSAASECDDLTERLISSLMLESFLSSRFIRFSIALSSSRDRWSRFFNSVSCSTSVLYSSISAFSCNVISMSAAVLPRLLPIPASESTRSSIARWTWCTNISGRRMPRMENWCLSRTTKLTSLMPRHDCSQSSVEKTLRPSSGISLKLGQKEGKLTITEWAVRATLVCFERL
mmetsp:Transcript_9361/g.18202  ORF Transcript_9361/g.18202 Transcript_9361/m.18202 type:complete len:207 (+) Transcript_9361:115-735(+)